MVGPLLWLIVVVAIFFISASAYVSWQRYNRYKIQIRSISNLTKAQICSHVCSSNIATIMSYPTTNSMDNAFERNMDSSFERGTIQE